MTKDLKIRVGKLGRVFFKKGVYLYVGRAKRCLFTRLQRHERRKKKTFWHIDYLLKRKEARLSEIWLLERLRECCTARIFSTLARVEIIKEKFGASDCNCPTHLFYLRTRNKSKPILIKLGFKNIYPRDLCPLLHSNDKKGRVSPSENKIGK